jgi:hypothetical protein
LGVHFHGSGLAPPLLYRFSLARFSQVNANARTAGTQRRLPGARGERDTQMRVLIAYEERLHIYGVAIEDALRRCRPDISVMNVPLEDLKDQLERFAPHLVVCSGSNTIDPGGVAAWIELSPEPTEPSKFCINGEHSEASDPELDELLEAVDAAEELIRTGRDDLAGC